MLKKFYVLWTYVANYSRLIPVEAETPEEAHKTAAGYYDEEFQKKATVMVFDAPPVLLTYKGETMTVEEYREASKGDR